MKIDFTELPYRIQVLLMQEHAERIIRQDAMFREMKFHFGEQHSASGVRVNLRPRLHNPSR